MADGEVTVDELKTWILCRNKDLSMNRFRNVTMIGIMLEKEWNISYITIRWLIEYIQLGDFAVPVIVVITVVHELNRESLFKPIIIKSCWTTWIDPKTEFEPFPNLKNSPLGPQKLKNDPKIKSK